MGNFRRNLVTSVSVILASFIIFGIIFYWFAGDLGAQAKKVEESRATIRGRARLVETLARLKRNRLEVERYQTFVDALLPAQDGLLDFSRWLENLGRVHQISLRSSFQGATLTPTVDAAGTIGFLMEVDGSFSSLVEFFKELETRSARFLVTLDNFDVNRSGGSYKVSVYGRVFYR